MEVMKQACVEASSLDDNALLRKAYALAQWRILPILFGLWMLAWVGRSNVAFAKLQMVVDLRFSETVYGLGAGLFFVGYVLFGIPTTMLQKRFGAHTVLAGIAGAWGLTSVAMTFVDSAPTFYALRFLLGVFEAGFYPGVVLYFNAWFPGKRRTRNFSIFHSGSLFSTVTIGLTGGFVLEHMNGLAGFQGWRWMFFAQAIPTVVLACVAFMILPDLPRRAKWLSARQRALVEDDLRQNAEAINDTDDDRPLLLNPAVWILSAAYFSLLAATAALFFFSPTILREAGFGGYKEIGRAVAGACISGALGNVLICSIGGSAQRRRIFCVLASVFTAVSLSALVFVWHSSTIATFFLLALGFAGTGAGITLFWQMTVGLLSGKSLVVGVPLISSVANVAGFVTPFLIGYLRDATGTYASGFIMIACVQALGVAVLLFGVQHIVRRRSPVDAVSDRCPT
ncbi:sugar phosphate permease [Paraburkholderia sp. BL18I3N2]|uniref:MFS transporter n=1 Tax=Paraburkholderia sp. BL18I3N2 TaxID=1938799 RepID=UPI000D05384B|nr:MFS transporter [Paraburkholderia sp. BL18I3N2]PRX32946.1 sugar phosphate permease [Paraburkholderia sp. BL18I3N2]